MEVGVGNSPETAGVAMEFPVFDGAELSSPATVPPRLRRRLTETKSSTSPSSVEEIEAKLRNADLRRQICSARGQEYLRSVRIANAGVQTTRENGRMGKQVNRKGSKDKCEEIKLSCGHEKWVKAKASFIGHKTLKFYENLSSKARPKRRSSQYANEHNLGQRLEAKLQAAEQKSIIIQHEKQFELLDVARLSRGPLGDFHSRTTAATTTSMRATNRQYNVAESQLLLLSTLRPRSTLGLHLELTLDFHMGHKEEEVIKGRRGLGMPVLSYHDFYLTLLKDVLEHTNKFWVPLNLIGRGVNPLLCLVFIQRKISKLINVLVNCPRNNLFEINVNVKDA
ncbi:hypothetical protein OSB04_016376 [Centaurea solstitialis]|uniref:Uncharacterized protein n=1 Tax=Centaurea solstitialis TaxID=347529 RepID=A0AA38TE27_9ASTR|nr:hypothetical protein OSB04_016376 [Centaurea solstitialis]